jgi:hypothetical protein
MKKLVVNHLDKILVTSDCATIVKELEVRTLGGSFVVPQHSVVLMTARCSNLTSHALRCRVSSGIARISHGSMGGQSADSL